MKKIFSIFTAFFLLPLSVGAQGATDFKSLMQIFLDLLGRFMSILYAVAFVTFFWGIVKYIWNTNDPKAREEGTRWMVWSVVALFVMVTLWGIVGLLTRTFGFGPNIPVIPQLG